MEPPRTWKRAEDVLFRFVLDDVVLLVPRPEPEPEPFAVTGGAELWRLLQVPRTTHELVSSLSASAPMNTNADAEFEELLARLADLGAVDRIAV